MDVSTCDHSTCDRCISDLYYVMKNLSLKSYQQKMYEVTFQNKPELKGKISEESLPRYGNITNIKEIEPRTLYYVEEGEE